MRNRKSTLFIAFLLMSCFAQSQFNLKGRIKNYKGLPIELATVAISENDKEKKVLSDDKGAFSYNTNTKSRLRIIISCIGYESIDTLLQIESQSTYADFIMSPNKAMLKNVTVSQRKPPFERLVDRLIYNVEDNVNLTGIDLLDILSKMPLLEIKESSINIVGKEQVNVMINGRMQYLTGEALANLLRSIPSESIIRIEVITNPPSNYEALGNSGLINIITRKQRKIGYTGAINSTYVRASDNVGRIGFDLNYNQKGTAMFLSSNLGLGKNTSSLSNKIDYPLSLYEEVSSSIEKSKYQFYTIGFESNISKSISLGSSYSLTESRPDMILHTNVSQVDKARLVDSITSIQANNLKYFKDQSLNIHLTNKIDSSGKRYDIDIDWYNNKFNLNTIVSSIKTKQNEVAPNSTLILASPKNTESEVITGNLNFDLPLKKALLSFGGKLSLIDSKSELFFYRSSGNSVNDSSSYNFFNYKESIQALFGNYSKTVKQFNFKVGIRAENASTRGGGIDGSTQVSQSYLNLFPTFYVSHKNKKGNTISWNYGRRYRRPSINSLNPFRVYESNYSVREGNPLLNPYFTNNFELSYNIKNSLDFMLSYGKTYESIFYVDKFNSQTFVTVSTPYNYINTESFLFNLFCPIPKIKTLTQQVNISIYYKTVQSELKITEQNLKGLSGNFRYSNTVTFGRLQNLSGGLIYNLQLPEVSGISRYKAYQSIDFSGRYTFYNSKMILNISLRDLFKSQNFYWSQTVNGITRKAFSNNNSRRFSLSLRYKFGNNKLKLGSSHSSNSSEQGRVGI